MRKTGMWQEEGAVAGSGGSATVAYRNNVHQEWCRNTNTGRTRRQRQTVAKASTGNSRLQNGGVHGGAAGGTRVAAWWQAKPPHRVRRIIQCDQTVYAVHVVCGVVERGVGQAHGSVRTQAGVITAGTGNQRNSRQLNHNQNQAVPNLTQQNSRHVA